MAETASVQQGAAGSAAPYPSQVTANPIANDQSVYQAAFVALPHLATTGDYFNVSVMVALGGSPPTTALLNTVINATDATSFQYSVASVQVIPQTSIVVSFQVWKPVSVVWPPEVLIDITLSYSSEYPGPGEGSRPSATAVGQA